jgi:quercetin dioxygenase-like cupin family protein
MTVMTAAQREGLGDAKAVAGIAATIAAMLSATADRCPHLPVADPTQRTGIRILSTPEHDVWLLRWPKGTRVQPHDHGGSVGAFSVVHGALLELRWQATGTVSRRVHAGETVTVDRGVVHDVVGGTDGALSVHVYSPPLSGMGFYDDEEATRLVKFEVVADDRLGADDCNGAGTDLADVAGVPVEAVAVGS